MKNRNLFLVLLIFVSLILSNLLKAQFLDNNGNKYNPNHSPHKFPFTKFSYPKSAKDWDSVRPLSEINKIDTADAYPYISPDGLRLYFTQDNGINNLYYVSRNDNNIKTLFSNKQLVSSKFPDGSFSCWLTNDELGIFFVNNDTLYYSTRLSIGSPFTAPFKVNLIGNFNGFISGPSLTPNKQELYLFNKVNTSSLILKFVNTGNLAYTLNDTLNVPLNLIADPGQLSKDGLKYYISLSDSTDKTRLYQLDRANTSAIFSNLAILSNNINDTSFYNGQPSVSSEESILVWVRNHYDNWADNDLYIANNPTAGIPVIHNNMLEFSEVFPNPCTNNTTVKFKLNYNETVSLSIVDICGRTLLQLRNNYSIGLHQETLNLNKISTGIYFLKIETEYSLKTVKLII